jgi:sugar lactone lactonase YvrE
MSCNLCANSSCSGAVGPRGMTGLTGATGAVGPTRTEPGPIGRSGAPVNPLDVAMLKFFDYKNSPDNIFLVGNTPEGQLPICFDGTYIWGGSTEGLAALPVSSRTTVQTAATDFNGNTVGICNSMVCDGINMWYIGQSGNISNVVIAKLNLVTGLQVATSTLSGAVFQASCFDGTYIWTHNAADGSLYVYTPSDTGALSPVVTFNIDPGNFCYGMCFDGTDLFLTNFPQSAVYKINRITGAVMNIFIMPGDPHGIIFDGQNLWVAIEDGNTVVKVDRTNGVYLATVTLPFSTPRDLAFDGYNIWVTSVSNSAVAKISVATSTVIASYTVPNACGIAFDGKSIWVYDPIGTNLHKF